MAAPLYHTAEMVRSLIDETRHWPRYETVHGELLLTPAPRPWHQSVALGLASSLSEYLRTAPPAAHSRVALDAERLEKLRRK